MYVWLYEYIKFIQMYAHKLNIFEWYNFLMDAFSDKHCGNYVIVKKEMSMLVPSKNV